MTLFPYTTLFRSVCKYGRVGGRSSWRRSGGGAAGVGFGVGAGFSGEAAPSGAASPRATCGSSGPGEALEFSCLLLDPGRRIWRVGAGARRASRLRAASRWKLAAARRWCWRVRGCAVFLHRLNLRRAWSSGRARVGVGSCGAFQDWSSPRAVDRWWTATFVFDAGEAVASSGSASSTYKFLYSVVVLCTLYVVCA